MRDVYKTTHMIDGVTYKVQCEKLNGYIDFDDCNHDSGVSGSVNQELADMIGWDAVLSILEEGFFDNLMTQGEDVDYYDEKDANDFNKFLNGVDHED